MSQRFGDNTPVVKVELKRMSVPELIAGDPVLAASPVIKVLGAPLLSKGTLRRFPDKVVVLQQGDVGDSLFVVMAGDVRLFGRRDADSAELGMAHRGDAFGEGEVLAGGGGRRCSAVAQGQVDVLELPRALLLSGPALAAPLAAHLKQLEGQRLKALDEMSDFLNRW